MICQQNENTAFRGNCLFPVTAATLPGLSVFFMGDFFYRRKVLWGHKPWLGSRLGIIFVTANLLHLKTCSQKAYVFNFIKLVWRFCGKHKWGSTHVYKRYNCVADCKREAPHQIFVRKMMLWVSMRSCPVLICQRLSPNLGCLLKCVNFISRGTDEEGQIFNPFAINDKAQIQTCVVKYPVHYLWQCTIC